MNKNLFKAVEIFKELGWQEATYDNVMELPLGTHEQQKIALSGLKSGEWGEFKKGSNKCTYYVDVSIEFLAIFAVLIGVDAKRASTILRRSIDHKVIVDIVSSRGEKYAIDFINLVCIEKARFFEHSSSAFGNCAVLLVDKLNLDIPQTLGYIKDWSVYAGKALSIHTEIRHDETALPTLEMIEKRFLEHIGIGVDVNAPATGPFSEVFLEGVKRGLVPRNKAIELTFIAIDSSIRPLDRKIWAEILHKLEVTDDELLELVEFLIPILALGDSYIISTIGTRLILKADDFYLSEIILASLSVNTKKTKVEVLKAIYERNKPKDVESLVPWFSMLANDKDKTISNKAKIIIEKWKIETDDIEEEKEELQGLWQETPKLWVCPKFEVGEVTAERLTDLLHEVINRPDTVHDIYLERFIAVLIELAYKDIESIKISLVGVKSDTIIFSNIKSKFNGMDLYRVRYKDTSRIGRDYIMIHKLGEIPCLLSTPSKEDLSISLSDLINRLKIYEEEGLSVEEHDFNLALERLDIDTKTKEDIEEIKNLKVSIVSEEGKKVENDVKEKLFTRLDTPNEKMVHAYITTYDDCVVSIDDYKIRYNDEVYRETGLRIRQAVRSQKPLNSGLAINILGAQRASETNLTADSELGVIEAWERGLLVPKVADIKKLDWSKKPRNIAAFVVALEKIAYEGMLSVVWPILDDIIKVSVKEDRLLMGTAEATDAILTFLPEVKVAIEKGIADKSELDLLGIRELALKKGSSRAVANAKKIVELIPKKDIVITEEFLMEKDFDEVWQKQEYDTVIIEDGAIINASWISFGKSDRTIMLTLKLPDIDDKVFKFIGNWYYSLNYEGQCRGTLVPIDEIENKTNETLWLRFDEEKNKLVIGEKRNWIEKSNSSVRLTNITYSISLLTLMCSTLVNMYSSGELKKVIERGDINVDVVRRGVRTIIAGGVITPVNLITILEKEIELLYILYPILTEGIKYASEVLNETGKIPAWTSRVLDNALKYSPYFVEATKRGLMCEEDSKWVGLSDLANSKAKSVSVEKARKLIGIIK